MEQSRCPRWVTSVSEALPNPLVGVLLFKLTLEILYIGFLFPNYEYYLFEFAPSPVKFIESYLLLIGLYFIAGFRQDRISSLFLYVLYLFTVIPLVSYYGLINGSRPFIYTCVAGFALTAVCERLRPPKFAQKQLTQNNDLRMVTVAGAFIVFALIPIVVVNSVPSIRPLLFQDINDIRYQFEQPHFLWGYFTVWLAKVATLVVMVWAAQQRRVFTFVATLAVHLVIYAYFPNKIFLYILPFVLGIVVLYRWQVHLQVLPIGLSISLIAAFFASVLSGIQFIAFQAIGRIFYLQAQNQTLYFRYFSDNPKLWFSTTPFGAAIIEYPYEKAIGAHLGDVYRNGGAFMNSGYLGDGFMHAGILGIIFVSLLFGMTLFTVRLLTQSLAVEKSGLVIAALMVPFFNLSQTGITIALATNGMVFGFGLVVIYTRMDDGSAPSWLKRSKVFQSYRRLNRLFAIAYENSKTKQALDHFD